MPDIYFDLDGTLTNPFEGISKCIVYALERMGEPVPDDEVLSGCIGPPLQDSFAALVGGDRAGEALVLYRERFGDVGWRENAPYAGIEDVLRELEQGGNRLFVATSKPHVYAERIVEHFGLASFFTRVFGSELDGRRTNKVELLAYALEKNAGRKDTSAGIMIGDREHDAIGAMENGMQFVGVTYGFGSKAELEAAGAARLAASPAEIPDCLGGWLK